MLSFSGKIIDVHPPRATAPGKSFFWAHRFSWPVYRIRDPFASGFRSIAIDPSATRYNWADDRQIRYPGLGPLEARTKNGGPLVRSTIFKLFDSGRIDVCKRIWCSAGGLRIRSPRRVNHHCPVSRFASPLERFAFMALCGTGGIFAVYLPLGRGLSRFATPLNVGYDMPPLESGDVVWFSTSTNLHRGDLALYDMPRTDAFGHIFIWRARVINTGLRISRVVAAQNDVVDWKSNQLWINGKPSTEPRPIGCLHTQ